MYEWPLQLFSKEVTFNGGILNLKGLAIVWTDLNSFSHASWGVLSPGTEMSQKSSLFDMISEIWSKYNLKINEFIKLSLMF